MGEKGAVVEELLDSLVKSGILVEYKDQSGDGRRDLSPVNAIKHGVNENAEANALESKMRPTELSVASTEKIAQRYLRVYIVSSKYAEELAKQYPSMLEDLRTKQKSW